MQRLKRIIFSIICYFFPINKRKIVISSYNGNGYSDNLKYIAEELLKEDKLKIIWIISEESVISSLPSKIIPCKKYSFSYFYHLSTARVWLDNCRKAYYFKKNKQLYVQTWHGGGAQKRIEKDVLDKLDFKYLRGATRDSKQTDLMISESKFTTDLYSRAFWYDGPIWEIGYPRYDILFNSSENIREKVFEYFKINKDDLIVLYAPTFRKNKDLDVYDLDFEKIKEVLEKKYNKKIVFLIRLHPNISNSKIKIKFNDYIKNATSYTDAQELLCAASILFGDYSSINFDFALMKKPVFRYAVDLDDYKKDRDFYYPFDKYPYPYAKNNNDLIKIINNFNYADYVKKVDDFLSELGFIRNNHSSKDIKNLIMDFIKSNLSSKKFITNNLEKFIYKN